MNSLSSLSTQWYIEYQTSLRDESAVDGSNLEKSFRGRLEDSSDSTSRVRFIATIVLTIFIAPC